MRARSVTLGELRACTEQAPLVLSFDAPVLWPSGDWPDGFVASRGNGAPVPLQAGRPCAPLDSSRPGPKWYIRPAPQAWPAALEATPASAWCPSPTDPSPIGAELIAWAEADRRSLLWLSDAPVGRVGPRAMCLGTSYDAAVAGVPLFPCRPAGAPWLQVTAYFASVAAYADARIYGVRRGAQLSGAGGVTAESAAAVGMCGAGNSVEAVYFLPGPWHALDWLAIDWTVDTLVTGELRLAVLPVSAPGDPRGRATFAYRSGDATEEIAILRVPGADERFHAARFPAAEGTSLVLASADDSALVAAIYESGEPGAVIEGRWPSNCRMTRSKGAGVIAQAMAIEVR